MYRCEWCKKFIWPWQDKPARVIQLLVAHYHKICWEQYWDKYLDILPYNFTPKQIMLGEGIPTEMILLMPHKQFERYADMRIDAVGHIDWDKEKANAKT